MLKICLRSKRIRDRELAAFLQQAGNLLSAGIPLSRTLELLKERFTRLPIAGLKERLLEGFSFAEGLREWRIASWILNSIKLGETTGELERELLRAADNLQSKLAFKRKITQALIYPSLVLTVSFICLLGLIFFILPTFNQMFSELNCPLPPLTRLMLSLPNYGLPGLVLVIVSVLSLSRIIKDGRIRLKLPFLGNIYRDHQVARLARALGQQIQSSLPVLSALKAGAEDLDPLYQKALGEIGEQIMNGDSLSSALGRFKHLFPGTFRQMVMVGEEGGLLGKMLLSAADHFEAEVENAVRSAVTLVEPVSTLVVGGVVGLIAFSMMLPLFSVMNSLI
jgi:type IV pilus assembly protein PilC